MTYENPHYLISSADLMADLRNPGRRIFDCTVHLRPAERGYHAESGLADFAAGHLPGAQFLDLIGAASDTTTGLPFSLPPVEQLEALFRELGIDDESEVVFYSAGDMKWATRAWWLAYYCGHPNIRVLDGGLEAWVENGFPVSTETQDFEPGRFSAVVRGGAFVSQEDVLEAIGDRAVCTVNALSPEVYSGEGEMNYGRKGHIEGSRNLHYPQLVEDGHFKGAAEIREILGAQGMLDAPRVICYCGSGISATIDSFACLLVGQENVAVYDGSMSEWVRDESKPMKKGGDP